MPHFIHSKICKTGFIKIVSIKNEFLAFAPNDLYIFISRLLKTSKSFQMMQTKRRRTRKGERDLERLKENKIDIPLNFSLSTQEKITHRGESFVNTVFINPDMSNRKQFRALFKIKQRYIWFTSLFKDPVVTFKAWDTC